MDERTIDKLLEKRIDDLIGSEMDQDQINENIGLINEKMDSLKNKLLKNKKMLNSEILTNETLMEIEHLVKLRLQSFRRYNCNHQRIEIPFDDSYIHADKDIEPLIREMLLAGIPILYSCQNTVPNNYIHLSFCSSRDLEWFLKIIFNDDITMMDYEDSIYNRAFNYEKFQKHAWLYETFVRYYPCKEDDNVITTCGLKFPQKDYQYILDMFKFFNDSSDELND